MKQVCSANFDAPVPHASGRHRQMLRFAAQGSPPRHSRRPVPRRPRARMEPVPWKGSPGMTSWSPHQLCAPGPLQTLGNSPCSEMPMSYRAQHGSLPCRLGSALQRSLGGSARPAVSNLVAEIARFAAFSPARAREPAMPDVLTCMSSRHGAGNDATHAARFKIPPPRRRPCCCSNTNIQTSLTRTRTRTRTRSACTGSAITARTPTRTNACANQPA